ncbi:MAG: galactose oxidase-like domain-containing protein, partial [Pseudonocardiaceae bacterium]
MALTTEPSASAQNGVAFGQQPVVQIQDAAGQATPSSGASVAVEVVENGATLNGTLSKAVDSQGKATFTDLSLTGTAGTYTLKFTSSGLTGVTSSGIDLSGIPQTATLTITTQPPSTALTGEVFDPALQPAVKLVDAGASPMAGVTVTASLAGGSGSLEGGLTATTDASGIAKFQDLGIAGTGAHTVQFTAGTLTVTSSNVTLSALPPEASSGKWDPPVSWGIVPLHIHLLPTGKLLAWGKFEEGTMVMGNPRLWDLAAGTPPTAATEVPADTMLFCGGHAFMADGKLMVSGGHKLDDRGLDVTNIFDPFTESWSHGLPKMAKGRWYPTVTELPDGRMVTVAGKDTTKSVVLLPEIWESNQWVTLPGASLELPYYPRDFVAPDGRIFYAGERAVSRWLDVDAMGAGGRGTWTNGPPHIWPHNREYGSAVMYDAGKILYVGGGGDLTWDTPDNNRSPVPTETAEKIDLTQSSPAWQPAGSLPTPRRHLNATVLPDGEVLVTGGVSGGGFNDLSTAQHAAEIWDPASPTNWATLASNSIDRGYHSVSILLPDATVLHGGSGNANIPNTSTPYPDQENHEIFEPPYLFKGARPTISSVVPAPPTPVAYGGTIQVNTPNLGQVAKVRIIRLGSVTHAFDQNGRAMTLPFATSVGGISVTAPANPELAPPGYA